MRSVSALCPPGATETNRLPDSLLRDCGTFSPVRGLRVGSGCVVRSRVAGVEKARGTSHVVSRTRFFPASGGPIDCGPGSGRFVSGRVALGLRCIAAWGGDLGPCRSGPGRGDPRGRPFGTGHCRRVGHALARPGTDVKALAVEQIRAQGRRSGAGPPPGSRLAYLFGLGLRSAPPLRRPLIISRWSGACPFAAAPELVYARGARI